MDDDKGQTIRTDLRSSEFCGPMELVARLLDGRTEARKAAPERYGKISDDGVKRIVMLCYYASQAGEEGRYPTFRVYAAPANVLDSDKSDPWQLLTLTQPLILDDVDDLRRLAPSASSHDFALEICEQGMAEGNAVVTCMGIRMAHSGDGGTKVLNSSLWTRSIRPGLMIRVDGPGQLRVSEGGRAFDLRAGHLLDLESLPTHLYQRWQAGLISRLTPEQGKQDVMQSTLHFVWHELLHSTSLNRHGGCYVVLPNAPVSSDNLSSKYGIRIKYHVGDLCLGETIATFVSTCLKGEKQPEAFQVIANEWIWQRYNLLSQIECLTNLSGVDGCTVFDGDLRLLGFGGKIEAKDATLNRPFKDFLTRQELDETVLARTGTRHLSAFRLCNSADEITCYVISQDGHVTLFWSDDSAVWRWSPYRPWTKASDHV